MAYGQPAQEVAVAVRERVLAHLRGLAGLPVGVVDMTLSDGSVGDRSS